MTSTSETYKILVVGYPGSGRSSVAIRFADNRFVDLYDPTTEDQFQRTCSIDDQTYQREIIDTAGQEDYYVAKYDYPGIMIDGYISVYSVGSRESFEEAQRLRSLIAMKRRSELFPFILVGNKADLEDGREVTCHEGKDVASRLGCKFIEISALTGAGVDEAFFELVRQIKDLKQANQPTSSATIEVPSESIPTSGCIPRCIIA